MTSQNEFGHLKKVFLKPAEGCFRGPRNIKNQWRDLHFSAPPDYFKAVAEYQKFVEIILDNGTEVDIFPADKADTLDAIYCRDASVVTDAGVVLCRMGKENRRFEPVNHESLYKKSGIPVLGSITKQGLLEGGDVAWIADNILAVGNGYRTNAEGFVQLSTLLQPHGISCLRVDLPHHKGPSDVFHLMSIFSPVDKDLAVVYSPLMSVWFRNYLFDLGYELIDVHHGEFEKMACNVLALAPRKCLMLDDLPKTRGALEKMGCEVLVYKGRHISVYGGGGPTCLTRPVLRSS